MASPAKYRAKLARLHVRILWLRIQGTKSMTRTHESWLNAANAELEEMAEVKIGLGGTVSYKAFEKPAEVVDLVLTYEAVCGVKLALSQAADAPFREKVELMLAVAGFGPEFTKMIAKAMRLPESDDLNEDNELDGVPVSVPAVKDEPKDTVLPFVKKERIK